MRKEFVFLFAALVLGTSTHLAGAQGLVVTLRGDVKDPGGAIVVGAKVAVTSEETDLNRAERWVLTMHIAHLIRLMGFG
jgi:hypothetical protein